MKPHRPCRPASCAIEERIGLAAPRAAAQAPQDLPAIAGAANQRGLRPGHIGRQRFGEGCRTGRDALLVDPLRAAAEHQHLDRRATLGLQAGVARQEPGLAAIGHTLPAASTITPKSSQSKRASALRDTGLSLIVRHAIKRATTLSGGPALASVCACAAGMASAARHSKAFAAWLKPRLRDDSRAGLGMTHSSLG
ncbi:hypothetical protein [Cupriavidus sp. D39]|uniref:hypothetical protein n=1 Tax=Cupriavidus sp. D39 TaxID=2997877 RepID=UPI002271C523|nr:hypothetical protein [Cupriavidus sp. D39]MCY0855915.1 hypothetical protein [Cupriavidus sp. D39]